MEARDTVTGVASREAFMAALAALHAGEAGATALLCLLDIDQFRFLNAVAGPDGGDQALREIAGWIGAALTPGEPIGRMGDDEFALCLLGPTPAVLRDRAGALLDGLRGCRLDWQGHVFSFSACAGLVPLAASGSAEQALHMAMAACGAAKDAGRGSIVLAGGNGSLPPRYHRDARILTGLQAAIADNRMRLYAQEIFSLGPRAGDVLQFELLVHMVDRDGTEFPPADIIPAAERHGFIRELDRWVIKAVLIDNAALLHRRPDLRLSVNLSGPSMADPALWPYVADLFARSGIPGRQIQFEITETSAIGDMAVALAFVQAARAHGCTVALDDFGSGLSSFIYLRTFPVDCIKIDGAFVGKVTDPGSVDHAIVTAIVGVARDLGLTVVAEHVDSSAVLATLRELGIDKVQGFLMSQPQPFKEMFEKGQV